MNSIEEFIQPEKKAQVDAGNLGSSWPAGTELLAQAKEEAPSTSSAALENVLTGEGCSSQALYEEDNVDLGSESDTVSVCESNRSMDDLYS